MSLYQALVLGGKKLIYGNRGEPYRIAGRTLRYLPGTRPVRLEYLDSPNDNVRYDALQLKLLAGGLSEGDVAIDIGAHCGQYAILMAAMCGSTGTVVAFEPDPYAYDLLKRNLALNPAIKPPRIERVAVSDQPGTAVLFSMHGDSRSSLARSAVETPDHKALEQFEVPVVKLDEYLAAHGIQEPRWIKIDTEGAEIRILKGAAGVLSSRAGIVCELHPYAWAEFGSHFEELRDLAARSGRRIRYLDQPDEFRGEPRYGTVLLERVT